MPGQGGLVIRNPNRPNPLAGVDLELTGDLADKVQQLLAEAINPSLASHGGFASLVGVEDTKVFLTMGGGCQGCALSAATLREGIQVAIREAIPEVTEIIDVTDHDAGENPFYELTVRRRSSNVSAAVHAGRAAPAMPSASRPSSAEDGVGLAVGEVGDGRAQHADLWLRWPTERARELVGDRGADAALAHPVLDREHAGMAGGVGEHVRVERLDDAGIPQGHRHAVGLELRRPRLRRRRASCRPR